MNANEFYVQFNRLAKKFNTANFKRYDEDVAELFYSTIKDMPVSWFKFLVNNAIGDMKPITLSELRDCMIRKKNEISSKEELKNLARAKVENNGLSKVFAIFDGATSMSEALKNAKKDMNKGMG